MIVIGKNQLKHKEFIYWQNVLPTLSLISSGAGH